MVDGILPYVIMNYNKRKVDMYKLKARKSRSVNPFTIKKGFYITEMNFGYVPGDGYELISDSDIAGPFNTLERARAVFVAIMKSEADYMMPHNYSIKGPQRLIDSVGGNGQYESPWYSIKEKESY